MTLRPPIRTGIDTATCDSALTLQARSSQLASNLPRHAAEPGDATAKASSSAADLNCNESSCKLSSSCCTSTNATAPDAAALQVRPRDAWRCCLTTQLHGQPQLQPPLQPHHQNLLQRHCPDAATKTAARRAPAAGGPAIFSSRPVNPAAVNAQKHGALAYKNCIARPDKTAAKPPGRPPLCAIITRDPTCSMLHACILHVGHVGHVVGLAMQFL